MASIKDFFFRKKVVDPMEHVKSFMAMDEYNAQPSAIGDTGSSYGYRYKPNPIYREVYDGERFWGQMGFPIDYQPDFRGLRIRSWQSYYESDITQIIIQNYLMWAVGSGLVLESEPMERMLKKFDSSFDRDNFVADVEEQWRLFANDKSVSHSGMQDLHELAWEAKLNAIVGGDVLVVERFDNSGINYQLIDGYHIFAPVGTSFDTEAKARGNEIKYGVEVNKRGEHIAFFVKDRAGKFKRIPAKHSKTGRRMAWLIYGTKYRIDDVRGMPLFSAVLAEMKNLSRYKEATIESAEERAKLIWAVEHAKDSVEENPWLKSIARPQVEPDSDDGKVPETSKFTNDAFAQDLAMSTNKQVINLPKDTKLSVPQTSNDLAFKDFFTTNFDIVCAALGIPPEVALAKYNSNYSASRMAVKTWEHKMEVIRNKFVKSFYKPIYMFWLDINILQGNIIANGYMTARMKRNKMIIHAFGYCEFYGVNMPHVDPIKEAKAIRTMLGDDKTPLTSFTKAARALNQGDWSKNIEKVRKEREESKDLMEVEEPKIENNDE